MAVHTSSYRLTFEGSGAIVEHAGAVAGCRTSGPHIISLPGLSEHVENDIRHYLQSGLSALLPQSPLTSIGTSGLGEQCAGATVNLETMAERSLRLAAALQRRRRIMGICTSMGTVTFNALANLNLDEGKPVEVQGQVLLSPALVPPKNITRDMLLRFLPRLVFDSARQTSHLPWSERVEAYRRLPNFGKQLLQDLPQLVNSISCLLPGTPEDQIERTVAHYRTLVITGENDPIGEIPMWQQLQTKYPDTLKLVTVPKRGHDLMLFRDGPSIVANAIHASGILEAA